MGISTTSDYNLHLSFNMKRENIYYSPADSYTQNDNQFISNIIDCTVNKRTVQCNTDKHACKDCKRLQKAV
jgi:hypothetical protein